MASASTFHEFWPDDLSLLDAKVVDSSRIHGPRQLTDLYLLALAVRHNGKFITLDASVSLDAIRSAEKKHLVTL
jgi:predicted nucleic acid-binding protein